MDNRLDNRSTQFLKGTLDMCLLALLARQPCYGYEMVQQLALHGLDLVSEGSIYPVLSRMLQHGYVESYLVSSTEGPRRKYYRLLPAGAKQLEYWQAEWETFARAVERVLKGERSHDHGQSADPRTDLRPR